MNAHIEKLAAEAGIDTMQGHRDCGNGEYEPHPYYEAWPEQLEAFARLIAEDLAEVVEFEIGVTHVSKLIRERYK